MDTSEVEDGGSVPDTHCLGGTPGEVENVTKWHEEYVDTLEAVGLELSFEGGVRSDRWLYVGRPRARCEQAVRAGVVFADLIPVDDREAWIAALEDVPHGFAHTWENCHAMAATSGRRTFLYRFDDGEVRAVCPLSEWPIGRYLDVVTPYGLSGFVGSGCIPSLPTHWSEQARARGYVSGYLLVNPVLGGELGFGGEATHHKVLFVLDLRLPEDILFARLSENRRRQVRRADAASGALVTDREALTRFFVDTYPSFIARRDGATAFRLREGSMRELCASRNVLLIGAQQGGSIRAVSLFGFTQHAGDFLFHASLPGEESWSAALIWAGVRALRGLGVPSLNLGGGVAEGDSLAEFKRRFGADQVSLRHIKQVYRPNVYRALCERAGVDPSQRGYFPPYRSLP